MSVKHIGLVLDNFEAPAALKLVAIILADHADGDGVCWPSYAKIAQRANMSERTVRRHVRSLIEQGVVTKLRTGTLIKQGDKVLRVSNAYRVNAHAIQGRKLLKLSTNEAVDSATDVHLGMAKSGRSRWTPVSTKPSRNHQVNRNEQLPVDNREPVSLNELFLQLLVDPDDQ